MFTETTTQIYVYLLNEGTDVWRAIEAVQTAEKVYRITSKPADDEEWQFQRGDLVRCEERVFKDGSNHLVAYEIVAK